MKAVASIILALFCSLYLSSQTVNVQTYGATPNNNSNDDYTAISAAIAACQNLANPILVFPEGTYHITSENSGTPYFPIDGIDNLTIQGDGLGAEIEFTGFNYNRHVFKFTNCKNLSVKNINIDYTETPFTQGKILNTWSGGMQIEVQQGFQNMEPTQKPDIRAYALYDNITGQQISNIEHFDDSQWGADWHWVDKNTRKINISGYNTAYNYPIGGYVLLRHKMYDGYSFIVSEGCEDVLFENIKIYIAPGYPFYTEKGPENISFTNCRVEKKQPDYWMTSTVDAAHLLDARGNITFDNCLFENMGDDGINMHGYFLNVFTRETNNRLLVGNVERGWYNDAGFKIGDKCEIFDKRTKRSFATVTISNIERLHYGSVNNQMRLTFVENIPAFSGEVWNYFLSNTSLHGTLTVKNSTIRDNRSRAILVSSSNVIIENNTFERNLLSAIKFEVSDSWFESTPARNVIIRNNIFDDANFFQTADYPGIITFKINKNSTSNVCDVFKNIRITGNTIKNSSAPFVYAKHVQNLEVSNNIFQNTTGDGNKIQYGESQNQVFNNNSNGVPDNLGSNCTDTTPTPSIVLDPKTLALSANETTRLSATVSPFTANVVWSSSNPSAATVNQDGEVTGGTASGQATITATITVNNIDYTDTCIVTNTANTLGVNEFENNTIKIFPNPSKGILNIHLDSNYQNATATLVDLSGRILLSEKLTNTENIFQVKSLSNGVYLLQINNNGKLIDTRKIILQN